MQLLGQRIHIAGSTGSNTPVDRLRYGHALIEQLVRALAAEGAVFGIGVGKTISAMISRHLDCYSIGR